MCQPTLSALGLARQDPGLALLCTQRLRWKKVPGPWVGTMEDSWSKITIMFKPRDLSGVDSPGSATFVIPTTLRSFFYLHVLAGL